MYAFRQERTPIPQETVRDRQGTFVEILLPYPPGDAVLEAQRCLQCAMPYCVQACPITQDCRGYISLIAEKKFDDAARLTIEANPLATVLCKTCYHYCEEDCVKADKGTAIAIRHLKRAALENGKADLTYAPTARRGERIAIVGGGPAGIMAAWELALRGYSITVFEEQPFLGGEVNTIPKYHLQGDELDRDLQRFRGLDITFRVGQKIGGDVTPEKLLQQGYEAVYLALGGSKARGLGVPGEHLPGVYYALSYLLAMNRGPEGLLGRKNRRVVVVGGGDVALDAARSSLRIAGPGDVTLVYRRTEKDMPAGGEELQGGQIEGVAFLYQRSPVAIVGKEQVEGIVLRRTQPGPPDAKGRPTVQEVPGSDETLACDTVIVAAGEMADTAGFPTELELLARHSWPEGTGPGHMTGVEGVFASGGRSVVYAMAAGTQAAEAIDAYVAKKKGRPPIPRPDPFGGATPPPPPSGYGGPTWQL